MKYFLILLIFIGCNSNPKKVQTSTEVSYQNDFIISKKTVQVNPSGMAYGPTLCNLSIQFENDLEEFTIDSIIYRNESCVPKINNNSLFCHFRIPSKNNPRLELDEENSIQETNTLDYHLSHKQALIFYNSGKRFLVDSIKIVRPRAVPMQQPNVRE